MNVWSKFHSNSSFPLADIQIFLSVPVSLAHETVSQRALKLQQLNELSYHSMYHLDWLFLTVTCQKDCCEKKKPHKCQAVSYARLRGKRSTKCEGWSSGDHDLKKKKNLNCMTILSFFKKSIDFSIRHCRPMKLTLKESFFFYLCHIYHPLQHTLLA